MTNHTHQQGYLERTIVALPLGIGSRLGPLFSGDGLKAKAMRGSVWTIFGYGTSQVLRLGSNLILTRLLFPEAFGLMALVGVFMQGLQMFSDVGIGPSIIQNKRGDDPAFLNTAWTIQVIRGFVLWLIACAIAWPIAQLYNEPMLAQLLPVAGFTAVIAGFNSTKLFTANRHLALGRLTAIELLCQVISLIALIALAWYLRSVWALVIGSLIGAAVKAILTHIGLPSSSNRFQWRWQAAKEMLKFGKWIFLSTLFTFMAGRGTELIYAALTSLSEFGMLAIAGILSWPIVQIFEQISQKVFFPSLASTNRDDRESFEKASKDVILKSLFVITPLFSIMAIAGAFATPILYDARYQSISIYFPIFCAISSTIAIQNIYSTILLADGDSKSLFRCKIIESILKFIAIIVGYKIGGTVGMLWLTAAVSTIVVGQYVWVTKSRRLSGVFPVIIVISIVFPACILASAISGISIK